MYIYIIFLLIVMCLLLMTRHLSYQKRQSYVVNFDFYIKVLEYNLEKAFDLIYKDRILVFSMSATSPKEEDFKKYTTDFSTLVLKLLGPTLVKEFTFLYGDIDTLIFTIVEYFNARSETDEIKQASLDQLMEQDEIGIQ